MAAEAVDHSRMDGMHGAARCTRLMLIRHAERPDPRAGIGGVNVAGAPDPHDLTVAGWRRAGALVRFFNPDHGTGRAGMAAPGAIFATPGAIFATPGAIFATRPTEHNPSRRPLHTVRPLAADLALVVDKSHAVHEEAALVPVALAAAATVLICWHHERIARIAGTLGIVLPDWPDHVYDRVLVFDACAEGWIVTTVQQHLLPGDS